MRVAVMMMGYAFIAYWGCRKIGPRGRPREAALYVLLIAYCAYISLAALRSWTTPTPTSLVRVLFLPAGKWLHSMVQDMG